MYQSTIHDMHQIYTNYMHQSIEYAAVLKQGTKRKHLVQTSEGSCRLRCPYTCPNSSRLINKSPTLNIYPGGIHRSSTRLQTCEELIYFQILYPIYNLQHIYGNSYRTLNPPNAYRHTFLTISLQHILKNCLCSSEIFRRCKNYIGK